MAEKDAAEKTLESYNDVFADIVNVFLFKGKKVVFEDDLEDAQTFSMYKDNDDFKSQERDVSKYWKRGKIRIALYGFENQTKVEEFMPLRIIGYDGEAYRSELNQKKLDENGKKRKLTKSDLYPVVTLVLYFGSSQWNKAKSIHGCIDVPDELKEFVSDYKINVFEIAHLEDDVVAKFKSDFRDVAEFFVAQRKGEEWKGSSKKMSHIYETLALLSAITRDSAFIDLCRTKAIPDGKEVSMCDVIEKLDKKSREAERKDLAKKILRRGKYTVEEIAEDTGLSVAEVESLRKEITK